MITNENNSIDKYRIVGEIASGSFGRIYRGEDTSRNNSIVAIKLLHTAQLASPQERNGFLQEARFLKMLKHPYILPVLDVGIDKNIPYLVTEYAPKGSLQDRLKELAPRPLPAKEALSILAQVGQALQYAHQQKVIHRDLKPANILFNVNGDALLADFGTATMLATSIKYSITIGTPLYMAPEQFRGTFSKEGDQYALGCITYELLTGRVPFTAPDFFSLGYKHLTETPIPPTQLNLLLPRALEQAILKALAKQRTDRHADVSAFLSDLGVSPLLSLSTIPPYSSIEDVADTYKHQRIATASLSTAEPVRLDREETGKMFALVASSPKALADASLSAPGAVEEMESLTGTSVATQDSKNSPDPDNGISRRRLWLSKHKWLIAASVFLVVLLISASVVYAAVFTPSNATVTITPVSLSDTYMISAVTGIPTVSFYQVHARLLHFTTPSHSHTVVVTGQGTTQAVQAKGTLVLSNTSTAQWPVPAGTNITNLTGTVVVITDAAVTVPAASGTVPGTAKVAAHVLQAGKNGNIAAGVIQNSCCGPSITATNPSPFSGGSDAKNYALVTQSDLSNASNPLKTSLTHSAQSSLQSQIRPHEKLAGTIECTSKVSYDHEAGSQATSVTATVTVTCNGEVYDQQAARAIAVNLLKTKLSPSSIGTPTTTVIQAKVVDTKGTVSLLIRVEIMKSSLFNSAQLRKLVRLIAGKSEQDAQAILLKQPGISRAVIKLSGGDGHTLPTDPARITVTVLG